MMILRQLHVFISSEEPFNISIKSVSIAGLLCLRCAACGEAVEIRHAYCGHCGHKQGETKCLGCIVYYLSECIVTKKIRSIPPCFLV